MPGERDAIEDVTEVDHATGDGGGEWPHSAGDHGDGEVFDASCVDDEGEDGRPPPGKSGLDDEDAEGRSEGDESESDGLHEFEPV